MRDAPLQSTLFGGVVPARRQDVAPARGAGYAATPGTGPVGETCGTCIFCRYRVIHIGGRKRRYYKCAVMVAAWTNSIGSDITKRASACRHWERGDPRQTGIER